MQTCLVIVPPGDDAVSKRIKVEIEKDYSPLVYEVKAWRAVKEPHLITPSGSPYWVTIWKIEKKDSNGPGTE